MFKVAIFFAAATLLCAQRRSLPQPPVVTPGATLGAAPSDAVILFDGQDLSNWTHQDGSPAKWTLQTGELICKSGTGDIFSKQTFGSVQLHVEFSVPNMPTAHDQARGNSGVYLQGRYEVQVLDSVNNPTYADGSCGALYGQYAPLVNVCRPPDQWQTYDIVFHPPKCRDGKVTQPGTLTVLQNGVLIQDHVTINGPTYGAADDRVCETGPLKLQDHQHPAVKSTAMRFRNIWFRPLE